MMSPRVSSTFLRLFLGFSLLFLTGALNAQPAIVVPPFESLAGGADSDWVAEAFSSGVTEALSGHGFRLVRREERMDALERLGLSAGMPFSRASAMRFAEELGADWLVLGSFTLRGQDLAVRAQVLELKTLRLSEPVEVAGRFADVQELAARLGWALLPRLDASFRQEWRRFRSRFEWVEVSAFESYLRGLISSDRQLQVRYWLQATTLSESFTPPRYHLGRAYLEQGNTTEAISWLNRVPAEDPYGADARFYLALAQFRRGDAALALEVLQPLAERFPVGPVWKNLAVFASRAGDDAADGYFESALVGDPMDASTHFNLGLHHLRWQRGDEASAALFEALELNPGDTEARFLLARALALAGRLEESKSVERQAIGEQPEMASDLADRQYDLDRLDSSFSSALARLYLQERAESSEPTARTDHLRLHLEKGDALLERGELDAAREEFVQAILLDPQSYDGHLRLARVFHRQKRLADAVAELRAAIWNRDTAQARVYLARIYIELDRRQDAREQAGVALALDPDDDEVRSLARELEVTQPLGAGGLR